MSKEKGQAAEKSLEPVDWWFDADSGCILSNKPQRENGPSLKYYPGYVVCETIRKSQAEAIIAVMRFNSPTALRLAGELADAVEPTVDQFLFGTSQDLNAGMRQLSKKARELKEALGGHEKT